MLICFDVDGVLETGQHPGPVSLAMLDQLMAEDGTDIFIVSPSPNRPDGPYPEVLGEDPSDREANLRWARELAPGHTMRLYVGPNGYFDAAARAGFTYVDRLTFVQMMQGRGHQERLLCPWCGQDTGVIAGDVLYLECPHCGATIGPQVPQPAPRS